MIIGQRRITLKTNKNNIDHSIKQLLKKYSKKDLTNCLVCLFLEMNNINTKNHFIKDNIKIMKDYDTNHIKNVLMMKKYDLNFLQIAFECLVSDHDKETYGIVYTPDIITKYITKNIIDKNTQSVCDPACGTGTFLLHAVKTIHESSGRQISDIIEQNIYGADLLEEHVFYSKIILILYMLLNGEDKSNIRFNIICCDSLTFDWKNEYPKVCDGFDAIIGNPPYLRIQDIPDSKKIKLEKRWKTCTGSYNLYFTFLELGMSILKKSGRLGYVCSNSFITSFAGKRLRKWLQENYFVQKILDFKHLVLFDATTYTCIIFLDKKEKNEIEYGYVSSYEELDNLDMIKFDNNPYSKINHNKWRLLKTEERKIIEKIESIGQPLGKISNIHSGIATLKDKVYFLPYSNKKYIKKIYDGNTYKIENEITKNIIKIPDIKNKSKLVSPTHKIIFPYKKIDNRYELLTEDEIKNNYPKCYKYLCAVKNVLATRDKGKQNYKAWYSYGRVQGFEIDDEKLLTPTFSSSPRFHFDMIGNSFFCNGYAICNSDLPLSVIQKILNSSIMEYYISRTSVFVEGGYCCFQKNFIEKFGIPDFSDFELQKIQQIDDSDMIDQILIEKYGINLLTN